MWTKVISLLHCVLQPVATIGQQQLPQGFDWLSVASLWLCLNNEQEVSCYCAMTFHQLHVYLFFLMKAPTQWDKEDIKKLS